jgi:hypothetical protein
VGSRPPPMVPGSRVYFSHHYLQLVSWLTGYTSIYSFLLLKGPNKVDKIYLETKCLTNLQVCLTFSPALYNLSNTWVFVHCAKIEGLTSSSSVWLSSTLAWDWTVIRVRVMKHPPSRFSQTILLNVCPISETKELHVCCAQVKNKPGERCTLCVYSWTVSRDANNYYVYTIMYTALGNCAPVFAVKLLAVRLACQSKRVWN